MNKFEFKITGTELNDEETHVAVRANGKISNYGMEATIFGFIKYLEMEHTECWLNAMERIVNEKLGKGEDK